MKLVYICPFKFIDDREKYSMRLILSLLTANAYLENDVVVFTDFEGMSVLTVLPFNTQIIYGNDYDEFKKNAERFIDYNYLLMDENIIFKPQTFYIEDYIENGELNKSLIENLSDNEITNRIWEISEILYNRIIKKVRKLEIVFK